MFFYGIVFKYINYNGYTCKRKLDVGKCMFIYVYRFYFAVEREESKVLHRGPVGGGA